MGTSQATSQSVSLPSPVVDSSESKAPRPLLTNRGLGHLSLRSVALRRGRRTEGRVRGRKTLAGTTLTYVRCRGSVPLERLVLGQNRALRPPQLGAGVDPELVGACGATP